MAGLTGVPVIPVYTANIRLAYRAVCLGSLLEVTRLPLVGIENIISIRQMKNIIGPPLRRLPCPADHARGAARAAETRRVRGAAADQGQVGYWLTSSEQCFTNGCNILGPL